MLLRIFCFVFAAPFLLCAKELKFEAQEIHQNLAEACAVGDLDRGGDLYIVSGK